MYIESLNTLMGLFIIFFVPGLFLSFALYPKRKMDAWDRATVSIALSVTLNALLPYATNVVLKIPLDAQLILVENLAVTVIAIVYMAARIRERPQIYLEIHEYGTEKILRNLSLILLLGTFAIASFAVHSVYQYPTSAAEWELIAHAINIGVNQAYTRENPYYAAGGPAVNDSLLDGGVNLLLAKVFILSAIDPLELYRYLPSFFAIIAGLSIFTLVKNATGKFPAGLLAIFFLAQLKNSILIPGSWFLSPATVSLPLIYTIMYLTAEGLEKEFSGKRDHRRIDLALAGIITLALAVMNSAAAILVLLIVALYVLMRPKTCLANIKRLAVYLIPAAPLIVSAVFGSTNPGSLLVKGIREGGVLASRPLYVLETYGVIPSFFAFLGVLSTIISDSKGKMMLSGFVVSAALIILYHLTGNAIIDSYENTLYYCLAFLAPLSALGLYKTLEFFCERFKGQLALLLCILVLGATAYPAYVDYYAGMDRLYNVLDDPTYEALKWISYTIGPNNVVLTRPELSVAVYPVTGNTVVAISPPSTVSDRERLEDNMMFFASNCSVKKEIIDKYGVEYLLVDVHDAYSLAGCRYKILYENRGVYIFEPADTNAGEPSEE